MPVKLTLIERQQIQVILDRYLPPGVTVYLFGSRAAGIAQPFSDLDLLLKGKQALDRAGIALLKEGFEESNLPFPVDVVDWHSIALAFREQIRDNLVLW